MNPMLEGAVAGLAATVPMTMAMAAMHRLLPAGERYPLPPAEITAEMARRAGLGRRSTPLATQAAHFAYGAATGVPLALMAGRQSPSVAQGVGYGLAVWGASYLGWIPARGVLRPAVSHPWRRNAMMLAAHVVWGAALAGCLGWLRRRDG